jgi:hypothetical protein
MKPRCACHKSHLQRQISFRSTVPAGRRTVAIDSQEFLKAMSPFGFGRLRHKSNNSTHRIMDTVTRYEWQGNWAVLLLLCLLGLTLPFAVVYFMTHLLKIETQVADGEKLNEFLRARG